MVAAFFLENCTSIIHEKGINYVRLLMISEVSAVTFDDFFTLRYPIGEKEDIIYQILKALKREDVGVDDEEFLKQYFKEDEHYRRKLRETSLESLLDDIVMKSLIACDYKSKSIDRIVKHAVDCGLAIKKARWFPKAKRTLITLRKRGYKLGLISNTHWRTLEDVTKEFESLFDVVTLSYEHGYTKPHPSIFLVTLNKLGTKANRCLHVGDDPVADVQGAKSVGMKTAFIMRKKVRTDADMEIKRVAELMALL
jgi:HAD superfamily hydrolase (TIGR01662 family)